MNQTPWLLKLLNAFLRASTRVKKQMTSQFTNSYEYINQPARTNRDSIFNNIVAGTFFGMSILGLSNLPIFHRQENPEMTQEDEECVLEEGEEKVQNNLKQKEPIDSLNKKMENRLEILEQKIELKKRSEFSTDSNESFSDFYGDFIQMERIRLFAAQILAFGHRLPEYANFENTLIWHMMTDALRNREPNVILIQFLNEVESRLRDPENPNYRVRDQNRQYPIPQIIHYLYRAFFDFLDIMDPPVQPYSRPENVEGQNPTNNSNTDSRDNQSGSSQSRESREDASGPSQSPESSIAEREEQDAIVRLSVFQDVLHDNRFNNSNIEGEPNSKEPGSSK